MADSGCDVDDQYVAEQSDPVPSTPTDEINVEVLRQQLKDMEDEQNALTERLQMTSEGQQLDSHLAVIEEQFRHDFDERLSSSTAARHRRVPRLPAVDNWETDILCVNRVFREVSRGLGDDWRPVFDDLVAGLPSDAIAEALQDIEQQQTLIQGYKALMAWRDLSADDFNIRRLADSLAKNDMNDLVDAMQHVLDSQFYF